MKNIYAFLMLTGTLFLTAVNTGTASSFQECQLKVDVLEVVSDVKENRIDFLSVKVVSLNNTIPELCDYKVGQQMSIKEITHQNIKLTELVAGVSLQLEYLLYSAMGEDGKAVDGEQWTITRIEST